MVAVAACAGGIDGLGYGAGVLERGGGADELFLEAHGGRDRVGGRGGEYGYVAVCGC